MKETGADETVKKICPSCGKRIAPGRRPGSITAFLFGASDCVCSRDGNTPVAAQAGLKGQSDDDSDFCPKCGMQIVTNSQDGSLTGFLFQSTRCKCTPDEAFADGKMTSKFWRLKQADSGTIFESATTQASPDTASSIGLAPGAIIGGVYKIIELIGWGGMGEIYLARHETLAKKCALKVIPPEQVTEVGWLRFQMEARAVAKLDHINLVRVTDLGIHDGCLPFYAMDYVEGENLAQLLDEHGPMTLDTVLEVFMQVCDGVECAHRSGILHRDLKPANIMVTTTKSGGRLAKVLDFGLVKLTSHDRTKQSLTAVGDVFGSPFYMSPEQCSGGKLDNRSDIYSLGCTMFECLTGRPPFSSHLAEAVFFGHLEGDPPTLESVVGPGKFPASMEIVIAKLLRKNPVERYQRLSQLKADLALVVDGKDVQPVYVSRDSKRVSVKWYDFAGVAEPTKQMKIPLLAVSCLVLLILAGYSIYSSCNSSPPYFSHKTASGGTEFVFPEERGIKSEWTLNGNGYRPVGPNPIEVPARGSLCFKAGEPFAHQPELFRRFRPDDLVSLSFNKGPRWQSKQLAEIARLKSVRELYLSQLRLKASDLEYVDQLPNLIRLSVSRTNLKGKDLSQLLHLGQLENLEANELEEVTPILDKLQNSRKIHGLSLALCDLTDDDLKKIGSMRHLEFLNIDRNPFTAAGLRFLADLKRLKYLSMLNDQIGPEAIETLHYLGCLEGLRINTTFWSPADKERLIQALPPGCRLDK